MSETLFLPSVLCMYSLCCSEPQVSCLILSYCDTVEMFTILYNDQFYVFQQFREVLNRWLCGSAQFVLHHHTNLETEGLLNTDSEVHLYALQWSFLFHIQKHLDFFQLNNSKCRWPTCLNQQMIAAS